MGGVGCWLDSLDSFSLGCQKPVPPPEPALALDTTHFASEKELNFLGAIKASSAIDVSKDVQVPSGPLHVDS